MLEGNIDILLPTTGKRMDGMIFQIQAFLNQSYKRLTVWVLVDSDNFNLVQARIKDRVFQYSNIEIIKVPDEWRGNHGHNAIKYALEKLPLKSEWFNTSGDDDCVMPWAMEHLIADSYDVDMVIGKCIATDRKHDYVDVILGKNIKLGEITGSCCLYRTSKVREFGYSLTENNYNADWELINKMVNKANWRKIDSVIYVMPQEFYN